MKKKSLFESKNTIVRVLVAFVRDIYDNQNLKKKIFLSPYFSQMKSCSLMLFSRGGHRSDLGRIRSQNLSPIGCAGGKWLSKSVRSVHRLDRVAVYSDDGLVGSVVGFHEMKRRNKKKWRKKL
jgi:hypothetical protein